MKNILTVATALLAAFPALVMGATVPNADTPLFYLVSTSQSTSNMLPVRLPSGGGGGYPSLSGDGTYAQFYFYQGALTVYDPNGNASPFRPLIDAHQDADGCQKYGAFGIVQGSSTNKCASYTTFQIASNSENSQLGAELVFNYLGGFYSCGSGAEIWYKIDASNGPSDCVRIHLYTVPVA
ncbi:hypothetical protein B0H34DRAFT_692346 [Crassisporium funariophilum]|nr:hypothetical protein B0H34DRAFT_692346 [Crassisporium funariophilum]